MTATLEDAPVTEENTSAADTDDDGDDDSKGKDRDFSKVRDLHTELANFINSHPDFVKAGLNSLSANQVKAVLYLRADYNNSPEKVKAREEKKAKREALKAQFASLSDDDIKVVKAAARKAEQAERMAAKAKQAQEDADRLIAEAKAKGAPVATEVAEAKADPEPEVAEEKTPAKRPGIGNRKR